MLSISNEKVRARLQARQRRSEVDNPEAAVELIRHFPAERFRGSLIGGFWPLHGEINILPLLKTCHDAGHNLALPCTPRIGKPLVFRAWQPSDTLKKGSFKTREPFPNKAECAPNVLLMPLLAFTQSGERLGYGGGFYDRTLEKLRREGNVFACGVAYAAQEAASLPTDAHDQRLDGILTETGFREF